MNYPRKIKWDNPFLILATFGLLGLLFYVNYLYVSSNTGGNDFLVQWVGTKQLITRESSPYSEETHNNIQIQADEQFIEADKEHLRFRYPLYSVLFFSPFSLIPDYLIARTLWMMTLEICLLITAILTLRLTKIKMDTIIVLPFLAFYYFGIHSVFALIDGDAVIITALFIVASLYLITQGMDEVAGVLLAFSTIKPQSATLLYVFMVYWIFRNKNWNVILWFLITFFFLAASSSLFIPNWIIENFALNLRNPEYLPYSTPALAVEELWFSQIGSRIGWAISGLVAIIVLLEWRNLGNKQVNRFIWLASLTLMANHWIGLPNGANNLILLLPGLALIISKMMERWGKSGRLISILLLSMSLISGWYLFFQTREFFEENLVLHPGFFFLLPLVTLFGLYWIRWWCFQDQVLIESD